MNDVEKAQKGICLTCHRAAGPGNAICPTCLAKTADATPYFYEREATYDTLRPLLRTGDVVLFRGKGRVSRWIRWWCSILRGLKVTWASHVGVVVIDSGRLMLFESTSIRGGVKGVRLIPLSDALAEYDGDIRVRRLMIARDTIFERQVKNFVTEKIGRPYEKSLLELMRSAWTIDRNKENTPDSLFCSELVALLYQRVGLLPWPNPSANNYTPEDFRLGGKVDRYLKYTDEPACLSHEIDVLKGGEA